MSKHFFCFLIILVCYSCNETQESLKTEAVSNSLFQLLESDQTGLDFTNRVADGEEFNVLTYRNFYNGGGVAIGDINNDGLSDVFFTANMEANRLYLNKGQMKFEEITEASGISGEKGWSTGVTMADVNGDGYMDIYVCNSGDIKGDNKKNELFINNGDLTFSEQAESYGLANSGFSTHASFFDYDQDGDLDCYVLNNSFKDPNKIQMNVKDRKDQDDEGGDKLYRNEGNGTFVDVTNEAGIYSSKIGFGLGVSISDVNHDNLPDIYVSNDFYERDYLYLNNGNGTFSEELTKKIDVCSISSMGADISDINNDGHPDIFTTDMLAADNYRIKAFTLFDSYSLKNLKYRESFHYQILQNTLQLNDGDANFQEVANLSNVAATDWSWGALIFDFDNDGKKDIFVANGIYKDIMYLDFTNFIHDKDEIKRIVTEKGKFDWRDFAEYIPSNPLSNYAFLNQTEGNSTIPNLVNQSAKLGLATPSFSNGSAYGDLDNDGDLDLIVNNVNMEAFLYENKSTNNYLKVKLKGSKDNSYGIGGKVEIETKKGHQSQQVYTARGFESSVDPDIIFGIGSEEMINSISITWPDGKIETRTAIPANQTLTFNITDASNDATQTKLKTNPIFREITSSAVKGKTKHTENLYNDFDHEQLAFKMVSTEGPTIIKGDLNGDGKEDMIIGGASGDLDKVFYQQNNQLVRQGGSWNKLAEDSKSIETTAGVIFDADSDGDNDVLLGAGGNEYMKGIEHFILRYYENDGKGNFTMQKSKTPFAAGNVSTIKATDFDNDGDQDLFIGCRIVPGNYGLPPRSFLMRNDGKNQWTDISTQEIGNAGMVTDASWSDIDGDNDQDLIIVGDWLPIMIFENNNGQFSFSNKQTNRPYAGWWNTITKADLDGDGDEDFIVGNWGENSKFKASEERKLSIFTKDFDQNKKSEFIINWYAPNDTKPYPFASKMDISNQLPSLKKKFLNYESYSKQTYETLLSEESRKGAFSYQVNTMASCILWNNGIKGFSITELPKEAQTAPIYTISVDDYNSDGIMDIWLGGNFYALQPQAGRSDSSKGILLQGKGNQQFEYISNKDSGIYIDGEVRASCLIRSNNSKILVIARNNDAIKAYSYN